MEEVHPETEGGDDPREPELTGLEHDDGAVELQDPNEEEQVGPEDEVHLGARGTLVVVWGSFLDLDEVEEVAERQLHPLILELVDRDGLGRQRKKAPTCLGRGLREWGSMARWVAD